MTSSLLECKRQLDQAIHNLRNTFPMGIRRIDDERDEKLKRLTLLRKRLYGDK